MSFTSKCLSVCCLETRLHHEGFRHIFDIQQFLVRLYGLFQHSITSLYLSTGIQSLGAAIQSSGTVWVLLQQLVKQAQGVYSFAL